MLLPKGNERRRYPRFDCAIPVRVRSGDAWVDATVTNLSLGGMRLHIRTALDGELAIQWVNTHSSVRMKLWAQVVRKDADGATLGVAFERMTAETADGLKSCLTAKAELQSRSGAAESRANR